MNSSTKKGFTLIELLIVIGILAILTAAVVVVLNPAELLKQARDAQRLSDLDSVKSAVSLYLATVSSPSLSDGAGSDEYYLTASSTTGEPFSSALTISSSTAIDGSGWVTVQLTDTSGGSPLSALPLDPTNNGTYFYGWASNNTNLTFELDTRLESTKHRGKMATDGGSANTCSSYTEQTCFYEIGTDPGLDL